MQQKMKSRLLLVCFQILIFPLFALASHAEDSLGWQIRGRSETLLEWQDVSGNSSSFVDEGMTWRQDLSLSLQKQIEQGLVGIDLGGRGTNNEQVDDRDMRLLYLQGYLRTRTWLFELGDVAASYSPMVLSTSARGAKVEYRSKDRDAGWDFSLMGGIQKATWEEIYDASRDESADRYVAGVNSTWKHAPAQSIGVAFSFVRDDPATVKSGGMLALDPAEAKTLGVEWDWRFNRYLTVRGETALTYTDSNTRDDAGEDTAGAVRIKVYTKPLPRSLRSNFLYERFDTEFKPIIASATSDRERFENDTEWMVNRELRMRLTLKQSRDNLDGSLGGTLTTRDAVLYASYRPDWLKRGDFGLRLQGQRSKGRNADQGLQAVQADFNYRPQGAWRYGAGLIYTFIDDDADGAEDQKIGTLRGTVGWRKRFAEGHQMRVTVGLDGNFINKDSGDLMGLGGRLDLGYDVGNLWSMDLFLSTRSNRNDATADTRFTTYQFRTNYHPGGDRSKSIRLTAERREYSSDDATADQDYQEHLVRLAYLFSF